MQLPHGQVYRRTVTTRLRRRVAHEVLGACSRPLRYMGAARVEGEPPAGFARPDTAGGVRVGRRVLGGRGR
eukprot:scaffold34121_cov45-Isochrysis_galbana.AAC.1